MPTEPVFSSEHFVFQQGLKIDYFHRVVRGESPVSNCSPVLLRGATLVLSTLLLLALRLSLLHGHLPHFSAQDNPASFADSPLTRALTYTYLGYFNLR